MKTISFTIGRSLTGCRLGNGLRHYQVISPPHEVHPGNPYGWNPEPPEHGCAWAVFEAETPAKAKAMAIYDSNFDSWRRCTVNPFGGLRASLFRCEHSVCLGCNSSCSECEWDE